MNVVVEGGLILSNKAMARSGTFLIMNKCFEIAFMIGFIEC